MSELDKYSEITDLNFDKENPHLAVCHKSQGYSANKRPVALLFKSEDTVVTKEIIKSLEGIVSEKELLKMSYENMRKSLSEALEAKFKEDRDEYDYFWVDVYDFNEDMVAFRIEGDLWAVDYSVDNDVVMIGDELRQTSRRDLYVDSESGEELIKASFWKKEEHPDDDKSEGVSIEGAKAIETPLEKTVTEEETMADEIKVEDTQEELVKASEVAAEIEKAVAKALAQRDQEHEVALQKAQLVSDTTDLVKGFNFIAEDDVEELVKCLVDNDALGAVIFKALDAAKEKVAEAEAEVIKVKEEFGKTEAVEGEVKDKEVTKSTATGKDRTAQLAELVKAAKQAQNK